jgi:hypothetical protein
MVENLEQPSLEETTKFRNLESSTQVALAEGSHGLLSLPHLLTIKTNGRKPLVDYSQIHVVILEKYLRIMRQKAMDKEVAKQIRKNKRKKRQEKTRKESKKSTYSVDCSSNTC